MIEWRQGQVVLDEYEVVRELGRGGMGCVWLVKSALTGRQFAVKRALLTGPSQRRAFLAELQTWIDLPEHPNILPCRFFRTVGGDVTIFCDYAPGGSLAEWIASKRITSTDAILDVAIQFALGLHAIHERGLVHQDVKPGNVLMTEIGVPQVTDFGLAQAVMHLDGAPSAVTGSGYMTPAYASPEQRSGGPLSKKTDMWSWGISVMDMFIGGVSCPYGGHIAMEVLEQCSAADTRERSAGIIPKEVSHVLKKCFSVDPASRHSSLNEAAQLLEDLYGRLTGRQYLRQPRLAGRVQSKRLRNVDRYTVGGSKWTDPCHWLVAALRSTGLSEEEAASKVAAMGSSRLSSRQSQLVRDIAIYDQAGQLLEDSIKKGNLSCETVLAPLCVDAALVHQAADDIRGAKELCARAIEIYRRHIGEHGRRELLGALAVAYMNQACLAEELGEVKQARLLRDAAIGIVEGMMSEDSRADIKEECAFFYRVKADAESCHGNVKCATDFYEKSISILEPLANDENRVDLDGMLALAYLNLGSVLKDEGDLHRATDMFSRVSEMLSPLVYLEHRNEVGGIMALGDLSSAMVSQKQGDYEAADILYDQALSELKVLVDKYGRAEFRGDLAAVYFNKALFKHEMGQYRESVELHDGALRLKEQLVVVEGRRDLSIDLANSYIGKADALKECGDIVESARLCDRAIDMLRRKDDMADHGRIAGVLGHAWVVKGIAISKEGDLRQTIDCIDKALSVQSDAYQKGYRSEVADGLASAFMNKATALEMHGDIENAIRALDSAIEVWRREEVDHLRLGVVGDRARAQGFRAVLLMTSGRKHDAQVEAAAALAVLRQEAERTSRLDLRSAIAFIEERVEEESDMSDDEIVDGSSVECYSCGELATVRIFESKAVIVDSKGREAILRDNVAMKCQDCGCIVCSRCVISNLSPLGFPICPSCEREAGPAFLSR